MISYGGSQFYQTLHRYPIASRLISKSLPSFFSTSAARAAKKKMPPKKAAPAEKKILLGRPGNNLKIGIVGLFVGICPPFLKRLTFSSAGLPNVGKSSFFNVLSQTGELFTFTTRYWCQTHHRIDLGKAANFPYATINPEEARVPVPDTRFDWLCELYKPVSRVPAALTCIDIAGLTAVSSLPQFFPQIVLRTNKGASTGAGLGNAFLSHVRAVDGIFQVVRGFDDAEVIHVEGDVNPLRDMEIIQTELRLKDIEWVEKSLDNLKKTNRSLGNTSLADKAKKEEIVRIIVL